MQKKATAEAVEKIVAIKGFGPDWKCRDYQFAVGQTYKHDGPVKACQSGFHAIEGYPLELFDYYAPSDSKYAKVTVSGSISRHHEDSKIAGAELSVLVELKIPEVVRSAVDFILARIESSKTETNTGYQSAATVEGKHSVAASFGIQGKAKASIGSAIVLCYRDETADGDEYGRIVHIKAAIVGQDGINADVFYTLDADGNFVEAQS